MHFSSRNSSLYMQQSVQCSLAQVKLRQVWVGEDLVTAQFVSSLCTNTHNYVHAAEKCNLISLPELKSTSQVVPWLWKAARGNYDALFVAFLFISFALALNERAKWMSASDHKGTCCCCCCCYNSSKALSGGQSTCLSSSSLSCVSFSLSLSLSSPEALTNLHKDRFA